MERAEGQAEAGSQVVTRLLEVRATRLNWRRRLVPKKVIGCFLSWGVGREWDVVDKIEKTPARGMYATLTAEGWGTEGDCACTLGLQKRGVISSALGMDDQLPCPDVRTSSVDNAPAGVRWYYEA